MYILSRMVHVLWHRDKQTDEISSSVDYILVQLLYGFGVDTVYKRLSEQKFVTFQKDSLKWLLQTESVECFSFSGGNYQLRC